MFDLSTETALSKYSLRGILRDPGTALAVGGMAAGAAGGALSASATLAGGNMAQQAGQAQKTAAYAQATQLDDNAAQAFASGQRQALDTTSRTNLAISSSMARAGASGVNAGVGSAAENQGSLAARGSYHALMDMFNGDSDATGLRNQAAATRYSGDLAEWEGNQKKNISRTAAMATIASTAGSTMSQAGKTFFPVPGSRS